MKKDENECSPGPQVQTKFQYSILSSSNDFRLVQMSLKQFKRIQTSSIEFEHNKF